MIADDVDEQAVAAKVGGNPAQALEVGTDLLDPARRAGVQGEHRLRADDAVGLQAVTGLEALDRLDQRRIVMAGTAGGFIETRFGLDQQAFAQRRDTRTARTRAQGRPARHLGPVAQHGQRLIVREALHQCAIERQIGRMRVDRRAQITRLQHRRQLARAFVRIGRRREVPLPIQRARIDLAVAKLEQQFDQRVRKQQFALGTGFHGRGLGCCAPQLVWAKVGRVQTVNLDGFDGGDERLDTGRVVPDGTPGARQVEERRGLVGIGRALAQALLDLQLQGAIGRGRRQRSIDRRALGSHRERSQRREQHTGRGRQRYKTLAQKRLGCE